MSWATLAKWGIGAAVTYFGGKALNFWGNDEPVPQQQQQPSQGQEAYPPQYQPYPTQGQQAYPPQYQPYPVQGQQAYPPQYQQYPQYMNPDFTSSLFGMKYQDDIFAGPMFAQMMGGGYGQPQYQYPPAPQQQLI